MPVRQSTVRVLSRGRVPRCSSPRQRSDISRGARGRDETWHVRPERRQVADIKPRTVALEGQEQQSRRFRLQWLHCRAQVGPKRCRHQTLLSSPKARRAREHLGWPGWSLEGTQSMLTMARLTVALLPTNMLRGMLHGEGDKSAAATSAAARHARLRCEEHARLRAGACEAHVPFACSTYAFACQYRASTPPAHVHTRRACSAAASL